MGEIGEALPADAMMVVKWGGIALASLLGFAILLRAMGPKGQEVVR